MCNVLSTLSQKLRNCVTSPLNFANVIFGSLYFNVHGVETVKLGCSKDTDESRDIEAFANVESGVINLMLEIDVVVDGFEAMLDVNVEAGAVEELLDVNVFSEIEVV